MSDMHEYTELSRQICAPDRLKKKVIYDFSQRKSLETGKRIRPVRLFSRLILAAVLLAALSLTAYAVVRAQGLVGFLSQRGLADSEALLALSTEGDGTVLEDGTPCLAAAKDDVAEYRVLEAVCDGSSLYMHLQVVPLRDDLLFIQQTVSPDDPVWVLGIPEISAGTVAEYAQSIGRELWYAELGPYFHGETLLDFGTEASTAADGSLDIYGSAPAPGSEAEFTLCFTGFTYGPGKYSFISPEEKTSFEVRIQAKGNEKELVFTQFDSRIQEEFGITIDKLVLRQTELGYYADFTYHGESAGSILFSMVDENGNYFQTRGPQGDSSSTENGDGSYSLTCSAPMVEHPEKLMFMLVDGSFDKHGPFSFSP